MTRRVLLATTVILSIVAVGTIATWRSARAQDETKGTVATAQKHESLDVQYARAELKLAELDLQQVLEANKRVRGMYPTAAIMPLRQVVTIAQEQLRQALHTDGGRLHEVHLREAEAAVNIAKADLQQALALNNASPGMVSQTEIERLRAAVDVAQLGLAKARSVDPSSPLEHLQWQQEELRKELLRLRSQVERLSARD